MSLLLGIIACVAVYCYIYTLAYVAVARSLSVCLCGWHTETHLRVKFKVACLVRQSLSGQAPLYLADDCRLVSDSTRRSLRSADVSTCVVPPTLSSYGDRTFAVGEPRLWTSLIVHLHNPEIAYGLFR